MGVVLLEEVVGSESQVTPSAHSSQLPAPVAMYPLPSGNTPFYKLPGSRVFITEETAKTVEVLRLCRFP